MTEYIDLESSEGGGTDGRRQQVCLVGTVTPPPLVPSTPIVFRPVTPVEPPIDNVPGSPQTPVFSPVPFPY